MPREGRSAGFDPVPVCAFCIENLTSASFSLVRRAFLKGRRNQLLLVVGLT